MLIYQSGYSTPADCAHASNLRYAVLTALRSAGYSKTTGNIIPHIIPSENLNLSKG